jgi:hypothetical protein
MNIKLQILLSHTCYLTIIGKFANNKCTDFTQILWKQNCLLTLLLIWYNHRNKMIKEMKKIHNDVIISREKYDDSIVQ